MDDGRDRAQVEAGSIDRRVRARDGLVERNVGGKTFLLTPNSQLHVLDNPSALDLWTAIREAGDRGISASRLAGGLVEKYAVDHRQARSDVEGFLDHMLREEVVVVMGDLPP